MIKSRTNVFIYIWRSFLFICEPVLILISFWCLTCCVHYNVFDLLIFKTAPSIAHSWYCKSLWEQTKRNDHCATLSNLRQSQTKGKVPCKRVMKKLKRKQPSPDRAAHPDSSGAEHDTILQSLETFKCIFKLSPNTNTCCQYWGIVVVSGILGFLGQYGAKRSSQKGVPSVV